MAKKKTVVDQANVAPGSEKRRFGMHPKLLMDVIRRQAGSLAKALLEGVMNSVDAKATRCDVLIASAQCSVSDDGTGIASKREIEAFFETFGQPHDSKEAKTYGTFRMGRGQMFAFGRNLWRTGQFEMDVDVQKLGLDYHLRQGLPEEKGCKVVIDLYSPLLPSDLRETERQLALWVKYAPIPVSINGKVVSTDPATQKWDHVLPEAYIKLDSSSDFQVYNLGIHVMNMSSYRFGTGGVIVSRDQLQVNFARNDIQSTCPVWKAVKPIIDRISKERLSRVRERMSDAERQRLINLLCDGEPSGVPGILGQKLVMNVTGKYDSVYDVYRRARDLSGRITATEAGSSMGDKVMQQKLAYVVSTYTLESFKCENVSAFHQKLAQIFSVEDQHGAHKGFTTMVKPVEFALLTKDMKGDHQLFEDGEATPVESVWLELVRSCQNYLWQGHQRKIVMGKSEVASAWTDGSTYIAINRRFLRGLSFDSKGYTELGLLLAHEYSHCDSNVSSHVHGSDFYEKYHELSNSLPYFIKRCFDAGERLSDKCIDRLVKKYVREADKNEKTRRGLRAASDQILAAIKPADEEDEEATG